MRGTISLKSGTALSLSFLSLSYKLKVRIRSGHRVMTSCMASCSIEIGGFCDLSHLGEFHCCFNVFLHLRWHYWCIWIYRCHIQLPRGQDHARSRVPWAVSVAHFDRYFSNFTAMLSLRDIVKSKPNAGFGISTYELTICNPPCVKVSEVIRGHLRLLT